MPPPGDRTAKQKRGAGRTALIAAAVVFLMVGAAFAAVPLYRAFCEMTGFGGTTQRAERASSVVLDRTVRVGFDTNVRDGLPWTFTAEQRSVELKIGATGMAFFKVKNTADHAITARATYNVVPQAAGIHFRKLECFCFSDQTLQPGEVAEFPMIFYVDPAFAEDDETKGGSDITLSYSFFPTPIGEGAAASGAGAVKAAARRTPNASGQPLGERARAGL